MNQDFTLRTQRFDKGSSQRVTQCLTKFFLRLLLSFLSLLLQSLSKSLRPDSLSPDLLVVDGHVYIYGQSLYTLTYTQSPFSLKRKDEGLTNTFTFISSYQFHLKVRCVSTTTETCTTNLYYYSELERFGVNRMNIYRNYTFLQFNLIHPGLT